MAVVIAGISGPVWGATDEAFLFSNSLEGTATADKSELVNGQNEVVQWVWSKHNQSGTITGKVRTVTGLPGTALIGHIISIADTQIGTTLPSGDWYIDEVTHSKTNDSWMEFTANVSSVPDPSTGSFTTTT